MLDYMLHDDTILYSTIHTLTDCISLQEDLKTLCPSTPINVNNYMKITLKHNIISYNYIIIMLKLKKSHQPNTLVSLLTIT